MDNLLGEFVGTMVLLVLAVVYVRTLRWKNRKGRPVAGLI